MNKLLVGLDKQAKDYAAMKILETDEGMVGFNRHYVEKLAELVVQECLAVCDSVEADDEMPGLGDGALVCGIEIRAKFGINE
jgi:hypothetical protein